MNWEFPEKAGDCTVEVHGGSIRVTRAFMRSFNQQWPFVVAELYKENGSSEERLGVLRFCATEDEAIDIQRTLIFELEATNYVPDAKPSQVQVH